MLSLLNPVIYIWMPWHYTTVSLLPFLSAGIYFGWKAWKAEKLSCKTGYAAVTGVLTVLGMRIRVTEAILLIAFLIMAVCMGGWKKQLVVLRAFVSSDVRNDLDADWSGQKPLCGF